MIAETSTITDTCTGGAGLKNRGANGNGNGAAKVAEKKEKVYSGSEWLWLSRDWTGLMRSRASRHHPAPSTTLTPVHDRPLPHPEEHKFALAPSTRVNKDSLFQHVLTFGLIFLAYWINTLPSTHRLYDHLNERYGNFSINLWGTLIVSSALYWVLGLIFMALDMNPTLHSLVAKYKIQPDRQITWAEYRQVLVIVLRNQVFVNLPLTFLIAYFTPLDTRSETLPGLWTTVWVYFACMLCEEAGFYGVHRAVHSPKLYARFHKMHHQFTAPVAFASTYCTMFEQTFVSRATELASRHYAANNQSNLGPVALGIVLIRPHWSLMILFFCSLEIGTLNTQ